MRRASICWAGVFSFKPAHWARALSVSYSFLVLFPHELEDGRRAAVAGRGQFPLGAQAGNDLGREAQTGAAAPQVGFRAVNLGFAGRTAQDTAQKSLRKVAHSALQVFSTGNNNRGGREDATLPFPPSDAGAPTRWGPSRDSCRPWSRPRPQR